MAERYFNQTDQDALFKEFYGKAGGSVVNPKAPLASILMKNKNAQWVGSEFIEPIRMSSGVGLGYRSLGQNLPSPMAAIRQKVSFTAKRAYATAEFDREAIVASRNDKGAFAKATVDEVEATQEGFLLHMIERALFADGSGKLGEVSATAVTGAGTDASPWVVTPTTTGTNAPVYKRQYFPLGAKIDLYSSGGVYQLTARVKTRTSTTISLVLVANGSAVIPASGDIMYWEGNRNQEIAGLANISPVAAGTLYGISQSDYPDFAGQVQTISGALQFDDVNNAVELSSQESGEDPNLGVCSHEAFALLKNLAEDQKRYNSIELKSSDAKIGFKGIEVITGSGSFGIIPSQMCPKNELHLLNTKHLQLVMRQDFGWFDDDGTILLRDQNKDLYNSRYGGYFEFYCSKPNAQYRVKGFTV